MKKFASVCLLALLLQGCGGVLYPGDTGNPRLVDDSYISQIVPHETNKYQVQALLGKPGAIARSSNGDTVWAYHYMKFWLNSYTSHSAEVIFDNKGIVKEYRYGEHSD